MIHAGFTIDNPYAQTRIVVLPSEAQTKGTGWLLEVRRPPKSGPDNTEHLHLTWTETFEIVSGTAYYKFNGVQGTLQTGEKVVMPPRQLHIHPWNAGESELVYRQSAAFEPPDPGAFEEVIGGLATVAALARAGKLSQHGQPQNPLQLAVTLKLAIKYGRYDASLPGWVQTFLAATLGSFAERLGYQAVDPQYLNEK